MFIAEANYPWLADEIAPAITDFIDIICPDAKITVASKLDMFSAEANCTWLMDDTVPAMVNKMYIYISL
ncbi:hypothetical protein GGI07_004434 [Coemansia sp. Benny D115]|nr:hypothetical protein GGI07_004434 [Coemansia sp. Benny D115]